LFQVSDVQGNKAGALAEAVAAEIAPEKGATQNRVMY
jgi:hypothetical protein